jgi:hypothetical protein
MQAQQRSAIYTFAKKIYKNKFHNIHTDTDDEDCQYYEGPSGNHFKS